MTMFAIAQLDQEMHALQIYLPTVMVVTYQISADTMEIRMCHTNQMDAQIVSHGEKFVPHLVTTARSLNQLR